MRKGLRELLSVLLFFSVLSSIQSQTKISGTIRSIPGGGSKLFFEYFLEDGWKQLTSLSTEANGSFNFDIPLDHSGQYRIRLSNDPDRWGDFILDLKRSPSPGINITIDYSDLKKQPIRVDQSKEHDAYSQLMSAYNKVSLNPDSLPRSSIEYLSRERDFFTLCNKLKSEYPNTFTGKVLADLLNAPISKEWENPSPNADSILAYNASHAFDKIPFTNPDILYHIGFIRKLNLTYDYYSQHGQTAQYIDKLMARALLDDKLEAFVFKFLLEKMIDYKNEEGLSYLITWYSQDCSENALVAQETKNLLLALENCKRGNTIEFLTLPDVNGTKISLQEICAKNKVTLILFWKTSCSHCREFEPVLKQLYEIYHPQGLEVYAIATDKMEAQWKSEMLAAPLPWPGVYLEYAARKDFSKRFPVPSTPTILAVDRNGKILRRLIQRSKIEPILIEMLNETK